MRCLIAVSVAVALLPSLALAQIEPLPSVSRSEQQVNDINRAIQAQQQGVGAGQQTQFELNQLRQGQQRNTLTPPPAILGRPGCPAGSIGC